MTTEFQGLDVADPWISLKQGGVDAHDLDVYRFPLKRNIAKRCLDVTLSFVTILAVLPLLLLVALLIKAGDGGPILYSHRRVGFRGREFDCLKFRTMRTDASTQLAALLKDDPQARAEWEEHRKLRNDPRITWVGEVLRKSSLDELPQLLNVLCGQMSIVGPRPVTREELVRYGEHAGLYTAARPGLTGHWQTSGRSNTGFDHRVALDVEYVTRWSFSWDLRIMAKTVPVLLSREGAY